MAARDCQWGSVAKYVHCRSLVLRNEAAGINRQFIVWYACYTAVKVIGVHADIANRAISQCEY